MPDPLTKAIASNVRAEMGRARKSQAQVSVALGISQQALSRRLLAAYPFNTDQLGQLAQVLGVPVSRFMASTERVGAA